MKYRNGIHFQMENEKPAFVNFSRIVKGTHMKLISIKQYISLLLLTYF